MTYEQLKAYFTSKISLIYDQNQASELFYLLFEENNNFRKIDFALNRWEQAQNIDLWKEQILRLLKNEPVQYILGHADFFGLKFKVNSHVLIPRPETEELVQMILTDLVGKGPKAILDVGTGSGCIAGSLKQSRPQDKVYGLDVSEAALSVADQNARDFKLDVEWLLADIDSYNTPTKFDIIVSNPPYVPLSDKDEMSQNVLDFEPHLALFAPENDPLHYYKSIGEFAKRSLNKSGGRLYFEAHHIYASDVHEYYMQFAESKLVKDMYGKARFISISF